MAHTPRHNRQYVIAGTRAPYSGRVIMIAGEPFTTVGGGIEGNNQRLEDSQQNQTTIGFGDDLGLDDFSPNTGASVRNVNNPVTRTFISRVVYYFKNGSQVRVGSKLHQHQDGTIMLGHDANNMGAIVTRIRPSSNDASFANDDLGLDDFDPNSGGSSNTGRMSRNNGQMRTQTRTSRTRTSGGGNGGGY